MGLGAERCPAVVTSLEGMGDVLPMASLSLGATVAALGWIRGSGDPNPLLPMACFLNGSFYAGNALHNGVLRVVLSDCLCALSLEKGVTNGVLYFRFA